MKFQDSRTKSHLTEQIDYVKPIENVANTQGDIKCQIEEVYVKQEEIAEPNIKIEHKDDLNIDVDLEFEPNEIKAFKADAVFVHEDVRYPCDQCDYKATQKGSLKRHTTWSTVRVPLCGQNNFF